MAPPMGAQPGFGMVRTGTRTHSYRITYCLMMPTSYIYIYLTCGAPPPLSFPPPGLCSRARGPHDSSHDDGTDPHDETSSHWGCRTWSAGKLNTHCVTVSTQQHKVTRVVQRVVSHLTRSEEHTSELQSR